MKTSPGPCLGLALLFFLAGCGSGAPDSVKNAKEANAEKIDSQKTMEHPADSATMLLSKEDADFVVNAASGSMMEVQLGQMAQTRSSNQRIKALGAMLVTDHSAMGEKLKAFAVARHITLPVAVSNKQQKEIDDLQKEKDRNFDRAFIRRAVSDHRSDIKDFEKKSKKGGNPEIAAFAGSSLDILRRHLDSADNLRKILGMDSIVAVPPPYQ